MFASHYPHSAEGKALPRSCFGGWEAVCQPQCPARWPSFRGWRGTPISVFSCLRDLHRHCHYSNRSNGVGTEKGELRVFQLSPTFFFPKAWDFITPEHIKSLSCLQNLQLHRVCLSLVIIT